MGGLYRAALGFTGNAPRPGAPDGSGHRSLEAGSALPSVPGSALPVRPLKGAGFFFTGSCGACHATLALPHPFGVRTDSCPGRSALHRVWEGGLGQGGRPPSLSPAEWTCGYQVSGSAPLLCP